jgi:hypothetical protein
MTQTSFYEALLPIEKTYWHKLADLFQLVAPQKPERGIETLILRARKASKHHGSDLEWELETVFQGAQERTRQRVALLGSCQLPKPPGN